MGNMNINYMIGTSTIDLQAGGVYSYFLALIHRYFPPKIGCPFPEITDFEINISTVQLKKNIY